MLPDGGNRYLSAATYEGLRWKTVSLDFAAGITGTGKAEKGFSAGER